MEEDDEGDAMEDNDKRGILHFWAHVYIGFRVQGLGNMCNVESLIYDNRNTHILRIIFPIFPTTKCQEP